MSEADETQESLANPIVAHASAIVAAYVRHNGIPAGQLPEFLRSVHRALAGLSSSGALTLGTQQKAAVPIKRSITPEYLICLEDGAKLKMLKRYLRTHYKLTPEEYRSKWGLPHDYPMVSAKYSARRSEFAKNIGLGKRPAVRKRGKKAQR